MDVLVNAHLGTLAFIAIVILALAAGVWLAGCRDGYSCRAVGDSLYECRDGGKEVCTKESGEIVDLDECEKGDAGEVYP